MPDVYYSERNLLEAAREGKQITEAEVRVLVDRLARLRGVRDRLLADLAAIKRQIEKVEGDLPPCDDWQTTINADQLQALGWCRVIAQLALDDLPGASLPEVTPPELSSESSDLASP